MSRLIKQAVVAAAVLWTCGCYFGYFGSFGYHTEVVEVGTAGGVSAATSAAPVGSTSAVPDGGGSYYVYADRWHYIPDYVHYPGGSYYYYDSAWHILPRDVPVVYGTPYFFYHPGHIGYWDGFRWVYIPSRYRFGYYYGGCWRLHPQHVHVYVTVSSGSRSHSGSSHGTWRQNVRLAPPKSEAMAAARAPRTKPGIYRPVQSSIPRGVDRRGTPPGWARNRASGGVTPSRPAASGAPSRLSQTDPAPRRPGATVVSPPPARTRTRSGGAPRSFTDTTPVPERAGNEPPARLRGSSGAEPRERAGSPSRTRPSRTPASSGEDKKKDEPEKGKLKAPARNWGPSTRGHGPSEPPQRSGHGSAAIASEPRSAPPAAVSPSRASRPDASASGARAGRSTPPRVPSSGPSEGRPSGAASSAPARLRARQPSASPARSPDSPSERSSPEKSRASAAPDEEEDEDEKGKRPARSGRTNSRR